MVLVTSNSVFCGLDMADIEKFEQLLKGDSGVFDVAVDGECIFSKNEKGRFPEDAEILDLLRARST